jgi:hypothetical protein
MPDPNVAESMASKTIDAGLLCRSIIAESVVSGSNVVRSIESRSILAVSSYSGSSVAESIVSEPILRVP